ncbi:MAG TPA: AI-2E family transporter [Candidatus Cloacimonadota bacterium]|nr:AI-2E family transporter [Candidatus Cloacimonadales bacterium]HPY96620.1 AI-2E family transporter [Candidatus Cloacimonadota bacterium]HQB40953.1 AI-2E family transporter [Candidatus Cloacimonadota bacterium]
MDERLRITSIKSWVIILLLLLCSIIFFRLIRTFISPIIIALSFTSLMYPMYKKILKLLNNKKNIASLLTCLFLILIIFIPLAIIFVILGNQISEIVSDINPYIVKLSELSQKEITSYFQGYSIYHYFERLDIDWVAVLLESANKLLKAITFLINRYSPSVFVFFINLFITIFSMFYFFRDGDKLIKFLQNLSPLGKEYNTKLFDTFTRISRATVKGTLIIGLVQGGLGALILWAFGIDTWLLWGFVMVICSIIPVIGAWSVLVPAGIIQIIIGNIWSGVTIILISSLIISNIDNIIRPVLVGKDAKMHDLMIFFSTLGGIGLFGIMGFIIGPVIASLFLALLEIYKQEFCKVE